jgi:SSS family solute:Na+ symporter
MVFVILSSYFILLVLIAFLVRKRNTDFDHFFFAGRKLGSLLIFFTVTASWFGAATTIVTFDDAIDNGFRSIWLLGIPTITTIIIFMLINNKIRNTGFTSLPDFLKTYYGRPVSFLASLLIFFYMVLLAASQFVAWGKFVGPIIRGNYHLTVILGALIVVLYSYIGGYLSVVLTDSLQLVLLLIGIIFLSLNFIKFPVPFFSNDFAIFSNLQFHLLIAISFTLAWVISPIIWQRIASAKSGKASRRGLFFSIIAFAGLYAAIILAAISVRQSAGMNLGKLIGNILPRATGIMIFMGIVAAIMSTADTAINLAALTLVKDILPLNKSRKTIRYSQITTWVSGFLAAIIALKFNSILKTLGLASEIMAEGLFVPGMAALFFRLKKPLAGLISLLSGGIFSTLVFLKAYGIALPLPDWPYSLPYGILLSLGGFLLGIIIEKHQG